MGEMVGEMVRGMIGRGGEEGVVVGGGEEEGGGTEEEEKHCVPRGVVVGTETLIILWAVLYWGSFFGTWIVYPLLTSYVDAADFHFSDRVTNAIKENVLVYR